MGATILLKVTAMFAWRPRHGPPCFELTPFFRRQAHVNVVVGKVCVLLSDALPPIHLDQSSWNRLKEPKSVTSNSLKRRLGHEGVG